MQDRCRVHAGALFALLAGLLVLAPIGARAGIVSMDIAEMADHAGQVITGTVTGIRSYWADSPRRIESEVTFAQVAYHKGELSDSGSTFRLIVPGGTVGEMSMRIGCAPSFTVGDKWLLFLLPEYRTFPVVGLSGGAFRVETDVDGVDRIFRANGAPVVGIDASSAVHLTESHRATTSARLIEANGVRLRLSPEPAQPTRAMSHEEFVAQIQPILDASYEHGLTGPAGRRVTVAYTPVPLIQSHTDASGSGRETASDGRMIERIGAQPREVTDTARRGDDVQRGPGR